MRRKRITTAHHNGPGFALEILADGGGLHAGDNEGVFGNQMAVSSSGNNFPVT